MKFIVLTSYTTRTQNTLHGYKELPPYSDQTKACCQNAVPWNFNLKFPDYMPLLEVHYFLSSCKRTDLPLQLLTDNPLLQISTYRAYTCTTNTRDDYTVLL